MASTHRRRRTFLSPHLRIQVNEQTIFNYSRNIHGALFTLENEPNADVFLTLAEMFNVIHVASNERGHDSVILKSGILALSAVGERFGRTGAIAVTRFESPALHQAATECDQLIRYLDIGALQRAMSRLVTSRRDFREASETAPARSAA